MGGDMQTGQLRKQRCKLVAALLTLRGNKQRADRQDINAAVILANFHLFHGKSASSALAEGYKVLHKARHSRRSLPLAHGSSGR